MVCDYTLQDHNLQDHSSNEGRRVESVEVVLDGSSDDMAQVLALEQEDHMHDQMGSRDNYPDNSDMCK